MSTETDEAIKQDLLCVETQVWLRLFVFEHNHNFHQLFGKLAGQTGLKGICQFAVVPERVFLGSFPEAIPYGRADFCFTQVAKNRARVVNFIRQRNQAGLSVNRFQVLDVSHLPRPPVLLLLTSGRVDYTVRTCVHNVRHTITKAVANICQTRLTSLVFGCIMQEPGNCHVFRASVEDRRKSP
jgi:hypothetical protein